MKMSSKTHMFPMTDTGPCIPFTEQSNLITSEDFHNEGNRVVWLTTWVPVDQETLCRSERPVNDIYKW